VKRQVRAVLYLADNPHASSRLRGEKKRAEIFRQTEASSAEARKHVRNPDWKVKMISGSFTWTSTHTHKNLDTCRKCL